LLPFCLESSSCLLSKNLKVKIYNIIIFLVFSYGCWSLSLREEHRLTVFEDRELRRIFGCKREGVRWIHLAQDRGWWWALVNTEVYLWVP
jgi:hypothetical protein